MTAHARPVQRAKAATVDGAVAVVHPASSSGWWWRAAPLDDWTVRVECARKSHSLGVGAAIATGMVRSSALIDAAQSRHDSQPTQRSAFA
jgi:hypothetical protein